ncbi:hypothetical protein FIBSPDRAFT_68487 [Athelia psychrophila]|uniref:Uncharacterized protein n=1 Tax=Athelia psychrophila TaxID=1759441 RepID=A0A166ER88_9AGAM|nr:hypothetical protein FIBSPDRAFT_68487 [Fibularhizoctonia sp. CBS 109695]
MTQGFRYLVDCSPRGLSMRVSNTPLDMGRCWSDMTAGGIYGTAAVNPKKCRVTIIGVEEVDNHV